MQLYYSANSLLRWHLETIYWKCAIGVLFPGAKRNHMVGTFWLLFAPPTTGSAFRGLLKFDLLGYWRSEVNSQLIDLSGYANYIKWLSTVIYENFNKPLRHRGGDRRNARRGNRCADLLRTLVLFRNRTGIDRLRRRQRCAQTLTA